MLSQKSEQFLVELRMYLLSKGKNDQQVNEITEELEDHLLQAETDGKSVEQIVGKSPKEYMKSIGETMNTDYRQLAIIAPMVVLLLAAYASLGPALKGTFALSKSIIWIAAIFAVIGIVIYSLLLFKIMPKVFHSKWFYMLSFAASIGCTGLMVGILLWFNKQEIEPDFIATPFQNNLIAIGCILIFIVSALYTKTWFTILLPFFLAIGPIAERMLPKEVNEDPTLIKITVISGFIVMGIVIFFLIRNRKKETE